MQKIGGCKVDENLAFFRDVIQVQRLNLDRGLGQLAHAEGGAALSAMRETVIDDESRSRATQRH
jgi:hypothetical protein